MGDRSGSRALDACLSLSRRWWSFHGSWLQPVVRSLVRRLGDEVRSPPGPAPPCPWSVGLAQHGGVYSLPAMTKYHRLGGLTYDAPFCSVLEAASPRSRCQQVGGLSLWLTGGAFSLCPYPVSLYKYCPPLF